MTLPIFSDEHAPRREYDASRLHDRKRKAAMDDDSDDSTSTSSLAHSKVTNRSKEHRLGYVSVPGLKYPRSIYAGNCNPIQPRSEREAVQDLLQDLRPDDEQYIALNAFSIYRPPNSIYHPGTLAPLSDLLTRRGNNTFYFDGLLKVGKKQHYVEAVPFEVVSVEGYEEDNITVRNGIYIQSRHLQRSDVWYKLGKPAGDYARFHDAYLWLADFCKHFVSYMLAHDAVTLVHFKSQFHTWIHKMHGAQSIFRSWQSAFGRTDFRTVIAAHYEYLWKESTSLGGKDAQKIRRQFIWREVDTAQLSAVPAQPYDLDGKTEVTPYVFKLFSHIYFGDQLAPTEPHQSEATTSGNSIITDSSPIGLAAIPTGQVKIGDVVCLARDVDGHWRDYELTWYAYVHDIEQNHDGQEQLHVFWLYRPSETTCGNMKYPFANELFFSDHCNCLCSKEARILSTDVKAKLAVNLFAASTSPGFTHFIRQTYITDDNVNLFITLHKNHLQCEHRTGNAATPPRHLQYSAGDTVLIQQHSKPWLEPATIVGFKADCKYVTVRTFLRRGRDLHDEDALPNEIVCSEKTLTVPSSHIKRACHVRYYIRQDVKRRLIPMPYSLGGVGDHWIVTGEIAADGSIAPCRLPLQFNEGYNPREATIEKQQILDLFCGSGSFGRGIEAGRAATVKWAVDIDKFAIHTKRANLDDPSGTALYYGSAVEYFSRAAAGRFSKLIAAPEEVDMIIAGSPCQGFSLLQDDAASARSRRNASMVALVVSFIDLYRPKYALLENVFGMTRKFGPNKDEDVFAQIVCSLVGLGYQCRYFLVEAFSHGGPQNRTRIFISIAAPGLTPIDCPPATHRAPANAKVRGIGRSLAGVSFGSRVFGGTPFPYVSTAESTKDLPNIGDGAVGFCVPFPDHRCTRTVKVHKSLLMQYIPRFPYCSGLIKAANRVPEALLGTFEKNALADGVTYPKTWSRIDPSGVFDTVTTSAKPDDTKNGRWLHWDQHRIITVMEVRRAQSFPDDTVLVGLPAQQFKLVGNAVSFNVATALGVRLRYALLRDKASTHRKSVVQESRTSTPVVVVKRTAIAIRKTNGSAHQLEETVRSDTMVAARAQSLSVKLCRGAQSYGVQLNGIRSNGIRSNGGKSNGRQSNVILVDLQEVDSSAVPEANGHVSTNSIISRTDAAGHTPAAKLTADASGRPSIVLRHERRDTFKIDSEDELNETEAVVESRTTEQTQSGSSAANGNSNKLTPIKWPRSEPSSRAEIAAAVAGGHHFAQYMAVDKQ